MVEIHRVDFLFLEIAYESEINGNTSVLSIAMAGIMASVRPNRMKAGELNICRRLVPFVQIPNERAESAKKIWLLAFGIVCDGRLPVSASMPGVVIKFFALESNLISKSKYRTKSRRDGVCRLIESQSCRRPRGATDLYQPKLRAPRVGLLIPPRDQAA